MPLIKDRNAALQASGSRPVEFTLDEVQVSMIGEPAAWFGLTIAEHDVEIRPHAPLPRRCTIKPIALFEHECGFVEANPTMGRMVFPNGGTTPQRYRPFTFDPGRHLRELLLPIETMPEDDRPHSAKRWLNCQAAAKRLLTRADVAWNGFRRDDIQSLVTFVNWPEPLDGCLLHALAQHTHARGSCVIEIGSFRGASLTAFALALRGVGCDSLLISVDPHDDMPHNAELARIALRQVSEERRLVQFPSLSDVAAKYLKPESASMIYIDGDHSYEQVVADFESYVGLLAPGGCLAFHDFGCGDHNGVPEAHPGVRRAVEERVFPCDRLQPLLLAHTLMAFTKLN